MVLLLHSAYFLFHFLVCQKKKLWGLSLSAFFDLFRLFSGVYVLISFSKVIPQKRPSIDLNINVVYLAPDVLDDANQSAILAFQTLVTKFLLILNGSRGDATRRETSLTLSFCAAAISVFHLRLSF